MLPFLRAGRQCAQTCTDANETLSTTGSHAGKVAALPVQEELSSYLTAAWQAHGAAHLDGRQTRTFYPGFEALGGLMAARPYTTRTRFFYGSS